MRHLRPLIAVAAASFLGLVLAFFMQDSRKLIVSPSSLNSSTSEQPTADQNNASLKGTELRCYDATGMFEIQLCDLLLKDELDHPTKIAFKVTFAEYDLNADGTNEIIGWESSWAGTSGGRLWVLERHQDKLRIRSYHEHGLWPPIGVLSTKNKGWHDLVAVVAGGGVEPHGVKFQFDGKGYKSPVADEDLENAEVIIRTSVSQTVFGPRPN